MVVDDHARANMEEVLAGVQDGTFAREWINENQAGRPAYGQRRHAEKNHEIEAVGEDLRGLFAWGETDDADEDETTNEPEATADD
jgi:ketol-acid reductoisomerase